MRDEARSLIQTQAVAVLLTLMVLLSRQGAPPFIFKSDIYFGVRVWYPLPRIFSSAAGFGCVRPVLGLDGGVLQLVVGRGRQQPV